MQAIIRAMGKKSKNQKGMTLVELLAVIVIMGIVAAIATFSIGSIISNSKEKADDRSAELIETAADMYLAEPEHSDATTLTVAELVTAGYLKEAPEPAQKGSFTITITGGKATAEFTATP